MDSFFAVKAVVYWRSHHYWTVAQRGSEWFRFDDGNVTKVAGPDVDSDRANVTTLIYDALQ